MKRNLIETSAKNKGLGLAKRAQIPTSFGEEKDVDGDGLFDN